MKHFSHLFVAVLLAATCLVSTPVLGQYKTLEVEAIDNHGVVPGTTYRVYVVMESEGDILDAVFGDGEDVLVVESTKPFYQSPLGGDLSKDTKRDVALANEELRYDSWVTIGFEDNYMNALTGFMIDFSGFTEGGRIFSDNGAWFVTPDMLQAQADERGRILIMQLTTEGVVSGMLNVHGRTRTTGAPGEEQFDVIDARGIPFSFGGE
jgi:hypothetical protein